MPKDLSSYYLKLMKSEMEINESVGQKIKKFRIREGLSQFELEDRIGASPGSLSRIENGQVNPSKETIIKIIEALDLRTFEAGALFNLDFNELSNIVRLARKLSSSLDIDQVLQNAVNEIVLELDLIGSIIFLIEGDHLYTKTITQTWYTELVLKILNLEKFNLNISLLKVTDNFVVKSIKDKKTYLSHDLKDFAKDVLSSKLSDLCAKVAGHRSAIIVPLIHNNESIGAVLFSKNEHSDFKDEMNILEAFAEHIATTIVNAQQFSKLQNEIKFLKYGK